MSNWRVYCKKADFAEIGRVYGVDQVIARIARNRNICTNEELDAYFSASYQSLHNPAQMKDLIKAVEIINKKIDEGVKIRVVGDYDVDGICSTTILVKAIRACGGIVDYSVPDRVSDGYGINIAIIDKALQDGIDTIVTCDNGIAAIEQVNYAKSKGMTVVVTDHHEIPFDEYNGEKHYIYSKADAIVDPKQESCAYPFKMLCGAGIAYEMMQVLYEYRKIQRLKELEEYKQLAAIASICDLVDLVDENRVLVRFGLDSMKDTTNKGIRALAEICAINLSEISSYHVGFVLGPCLNASGRLEKADIAIRLLMTEDTSEAKELAQHVKMLNETRKEMTEQETQKAIDMVNNSDLKNDTVLLIYLPSCHESIAGIIAGRVKEYFYKPTFVITKSVEGVKGSGRSIETYNMYEEINKCKNLLTKFGGHPMAAGLSFPEENIEPLRKMLNQNQTLTENDLIPVHWIDVAMPLWYVTMELIYQFKRLEPFGTGNEKPLFADSNLLVKRVDIIGKNKNVAKFVLEDVDGRIFDGIMFKITQENLPLKGQIISILYYPSINEYNGKKKIQFVIEEIKVKEVS